jgi:uncharacterized membrane protein YhiD involved in acid resistance
MAAGAGYYPAAVITTVLVLVTLWPLRRLAFWISTSVRRDEGRLVVELPAGASAASLLEVVEGAGANVRSLAFEDEGETRRVDMQLRTGSGRTAAALVDALNSAQNVKAARWNP